MSLHEPEHQTCANKAAHPYSKHRVSELYAHKCIPTILRTILMGTYILETITGSTYVVELTPTGSYFTGMGRCFASEEESAPTLGERYGFGGLISTSKVIKMTARI